MHHQVDVVEHEAAHPSASTPPASGPRAPSPRPTSSGPGNSRAISQRPRLRRPSDLHRHTPVGLGASGCRQRNSIRHGPQRKAPILPTGQVSPSAISSVQFERPGLPMASCSQPLPCLLVCGEPGGAARARQAPQRRQGRPRAMSTRHAPRPPDDPAGWAGVTCAAVIWSAAPAGPPAGCSRAWW